MREAFVPLIKRVGGVKSRLCNLLQSADVDRSRLKLSFVIVGLKMRVERRLVLFAALSMLPIAFGCQTMRGETAVAIPAVETETPQDQALSKSVRARLLADKKVNLSGIKVVSNNGTVYLSGVVSSLDARQQAIKLAWEVRGVQSVVNSLEVQ